MKQTCKAAVLAGIEYIAFGDLFLTDVRSYREKQLENSGLNPISRCGACPRWSLHVP
jgi:hypothetical protein